jgi:hypothetical protein
MSGLRDQKATLACLRLRKSAELAPVCCADRVGGFRLGAQPDWRAARLASLLAFDFSKRAA